MPELPKIAKDIRLQAPRRPTIVSKAVILCGTALVSVGALASPTAKADIASPTPTIVRISPPSSLLSASPLVLTPPDGIDVVAQHKSHASHASHASHYSSSGGSLPRATVPSATVAPSSGSKTSSEEKSATPPATDKIPPKSAPAAGSNTPTNAERATVALSSVPALAEIEIDGKFMGNTRSNLHLSPGAHQITIKKVGYDVWTKAIEVTAGSELAVHADLHASRPAAAKKTAPSKK
jgi:hypothetical protein